MKQHRKLSLCSVLFALCLLWGVPANAAERVLVFAAASLKDAIETLAEDYQRVHGQKVTVSLASSGTLARQIEAGAPADIYLSANPEWMDYLAARELVEPSSRAVVAGNALVIVRRAGQTARQDQADPALLLASDRFAMGDPMHVPAGIYAKQALEALGLWESVGKNAAYGENVRVGLAMASRGDVSGAIVYRSDAGLRDDLEIVYEFPAESHRPIHYPVALTKQADGEARAFLAYLLEHARAGALSTHGFSLPPDNTDATVHDG